MNVLWQTMRQVLQLPNVTNTVFSSEPGQATRMNLKYDWWWIRRSIYS